MNTYTSGTVVRLSAAFAVDSVATDPSTIVCKVRLPGSTTTTYTYGVDTGLIRLSAGNYYLDVTTSAGGAHPYRWQSTGAAAAAGEDVFYVTGALA